MTLVGWSTGSDYNAYIAGADDSALRRALSSAGVIVTFNGTLFDLRFIREHLRGLAIPPVHVDLRFLARRVGLAGGQKSIEKVLGSGGPESSKDFAAKPLLFCGTGIDAVILKLLDFCWPTTMPT